MDTKNKSVESNAKGKNTERDFTLSPIVHCYNCQGYGHVVANYQSLVRVIDKPPVTKSESDSEESIFQAKEPEESDFDKKIMGDNLAESSTSSPLEAVPVTTEFTDSTPIPSKVLWLKSLLMYPLKTILRIFLKSPL